MSNPPLLHGTCACTAITWTSTLPAQHLDFCYCTQSQPVSGAPMVAWLGIPRSSLHFSTSSNPVTTFRLLISNGMDSIATRSCCSNCGGTLSIQYDCYPEKTHIAAATVCEGAETLPEVGCHLFVKEKPSWYRVVEDGVPRYDGFPEEFLDVQREWDERQRREQYEAPQEAVDNEYTEEKSQPAAVQRQKQEHEDDEESDEEIAALRKKYAGHQSKPEHPAYEDVDSD